MQKTIYTTHNFFYKRIYAGGQFSPSNVTSFIYTAVAPAPVVGTKTTSERVVIFGEYAVG